MFDIILYIFATIGIVFSIVMVVAFIQSILDEGSIRAKGIEYMKNRKD